jgi:hypothetical protein
MKTRTQNTKSGLKSRPEQSSTENNTAANTQTPTEGKDSRLPIDHAQRLRNRTLPTPKLLNQLLTRLPDVYSVAEVVGKWVWVQFSQTPAAEIRQQLAQLGFHWNRARQTWQHPCGLYRDQAAIFDPRQKYGSYFAADMKPA